MENLAWTSRDMYLLWLLIDKQLLALFQQYVLYLLTWKYFDSYASEFRSKKSKIPGVLLYLFSFNGHSIVSPSCTCGNRKMECQSVRMVTKRIQVQINASMLTSVPREIFVAKPMENENRNNDRTGNFLHTIVNSS